MEKTGMVYLVGAGPGGPEMMTLRARDLIQSADIIIYDNLVNDRILPLFADPGSEKIYVGKSGSSHTMEQDDINRLLAEKAKTGRTIVRLKGGDPFIFGRGGEEALYLAEQGVPFEVVNGISSAYAVPAFAGIPVTHRGLASTVAFITGHEDPTKEESDIHWDRLATGVQTLVFLMGVKNLTAIAQELVKHGRDRETPVAVIQNGCSQNQRTVIGTLQTIAGIVASEKISPPSIIIVGDVVRLRERLSWFETRPLFGKRVVVTRSRDQASDLVKKLIDQGADVVEVPAISILPPDDRGPIEKSIASIDRYHWVVFTSVNGVDHFFKILHDRKKDSRALAGRKICAIGPATADRLGAHGIVPDFIPERFISTEIAKELDARGEISGSSFVLYRADIAPDSLSKSLLEMGAVSVDDITVYRTVKETAALVPAVSELLQEVNFDLVTFTSSSTVKNFADILEGLGVTGYGTIPCAAIGPVTADTAREIGFRVDFTAGVHTIDGLMDAILRNISRR